MRIATLAGSEAADGLARTDSEIADAYLRQMTLLVRGMPVKAMLGDATIVDQSTFETGGIRQYMNDIMSLLGSGGKKGDGGKDRWSLREAVETKDEDIRRIFAKFEARTSGYLLAVHMSVQFKALLYYKPDSAVIRIQKELGAIEESAKSDGDAEASDGDRIIAEHLRGMGHAEPDHMRLFEMFYNDSDLAERMADETGRAARDSGHVSHARRRKELFADLDALLMEVYNTTALMIDETRLVAGEDGFVYTADVEKITFDERNGTETREGRFDPDGMSKEEQDELLDLLCDLLCAVRQAPGLRAPDTENVHQT